MNSTSSILQYASAKTDINNAIFIFGTIVFIVGVVGNTVTVTFIFGSKTLHTPTYLTICCLAVADELASISRYLHILPVKSLVKDSKWNLLFSIFSFLFVHSSHFHMTLVSYVRYVFLGKPLESLEIDNKSIPKLSGNIWTYSFIVSTVYGIVLFLYDDGTIIGLTEFFFGFYVIGVPFALVIYFHIKKMYYLYNLHSLRIENNQIAGRLSRIFLIIISIYLASVLYPLLCTIIQMVFGSEAEVTRYFSLFYSNFFHLCLLFNNCINPLIYFVFSPPFLRFLSQARSRVCT